MIDDDNHKILNLSSFLYDIVEVESIINEIQQNNKFEEENIEFRYKIFNNIFLYQSLSLIEYHDILDQIVNNKGEDLNIKSIVIQDLDEAFNIASFEDYILGKLKLGTFFCFKLNNTNILFFWIQLVKLLQI